MAASGPPRKRRRPALSCVECRRRKVKCDRNNPCGQCTLSKSSTCTYREDAAPVTAPVTVPVTTVTPAPTAASITNSQAKLAWYGESPQGKNSDSLFHVLLNPGVSLTSNSNSDLPRQTEQPPSSRSAPSNPDAEGTIEHLNTRIHRLEQLLSDATKKPPTTAEDAFAARDGPKPMRGTLSKTRLFGPSHWMTSIEQFRLDDFVCASQTWKDTTTINFKKDAAEIHTLLQKCKVLARETKARHHTRWLFQPHLKESVPPREVADELIELYLRNYESAYRILHIPSFRNEYVQYWANPEAAGTGFIMKMLLVMAIGTNLYREHEMSNFRSIALQWVYAAQSWLSGPFEKRRLNLTGLQVHCLLIVARQTNYVGGDLVWASVGSLLRTAMVMGLHRDPRHFPKMSIFQTEMRRRLWTTILEMSIQSSLDAGMAPLISLDDFDTEAPSNVDDNNIDETTTFTPSKPSTAYSQTSLQITLLQSFRTRLRVVKAINDFHSEPSYDEVLRLNTELEGVCRDSTILMENYQSVAVGSADGVAAPTTFHKNLFTHLLLRFLVALHRPFAGKARTDPRYYFSRKICIDTAMTIISPEPDEDFSRLMCIGSGVFREFMTPNAVTIHHELIIQLEEDIRNMALARNKARREPLRVALKGLAALSEKRVQMGENNVKGFVFLSVAIGQADAMEAGTGVELGVFEAAHRSTRRAYEMLKARTGITTPPPDIDHGDDSCCPSTIPKEMDYVTPSSQGVEFNNQSLVGLDMLAEEPGLDFDLPTYWLFPDWDENSWV